MECHEDKKEIYLLIFDNFDFEFHFVLKMGNLSIMVDVNEDALAHFLYLTLLLINQNLGRFYQQQVSGCEIQFAYHLLDFVEVEMEYKYVQIQSKISNNSYIRLK